MKQSKKPEQIAELLRKIRECIEQGNYLLIEHAVLRLNERDIDLGDVEYVLKHGYHEKRKTCFDELFKTWKYSIRGKCLEDQTLRIIVAFDDKQLLIVTVISLEEGVKP